jgi:hypothetical protein
VNQTFATQLNYDIHTLTRNYDHSIVCIDIDMNRNHELLRKIISGSEYQNLMYWFQHNQILHLNQPNCERYSNFMPTKRGIQSDDDKTHVCWAAVLFEICFPRLSVIYLSPVLKDK